ncbi:MAG: hypothetical protein Q9224_006307 [Gallowayella concinna]
MLLGSADSRIKANSLCSELKQLAAQSQEGPRIEIPASIMETLLETDKDAASTIWSVIGSNVAQPLNAPDSRKARKSRLLGIPLMKTAHRSEGLKSVLASSHTLPENHHMSGGSSAGLNAREKSPTYHNASVSSTHSHRTHRPPLTSAPNTQVENIIPPIIAPSQSTRKAAKRPKIHTPQNVFQARKEIEKRDKRNLFRRERKDELLKLHFGKRDLKFLVDNGQSMRSHWAETEYLLKTLVLKAAGQDDDGLDLSFTLGQERLENKKSISKDWERAMEKAEPRNERTNMKTSLAELLQAYLEQVQEQKRHQWGKPLKKLTIIVLTDGIWAGMGNNQNAVNDTIVNFVHKLEKIVGDLIERLVSIEFVQLGNDPEATYRLRQLDIGMKWKGVPDIIDTEPASGDVNKMLLGSFVEDYDNEDEEDQLQDPETPLRQTTSPSEISHIDDSPRPWLRDSMNLPISPPEPPFFISGPTP